MYGAWRSASLRKYSGVTLVFSFDFFIALLTVAICPWVRYAASPENCCLRPFGRNWWWRASNPRRAFAYKAMPSRPARHPQSHEMQTPPLPGGVLRLGGVIDAARFEPLEMITLAHALAALS